MAVEYIITVYPCDIDGKRTDDRRFLSVFIPFDGTTPTLWVKTTDNIGQAQRFDYATACAVLEKIVDHRVDYDDDGHAELVHHLADDAVRSSSAPAEDAAEIVVVSNFFDAAAVKYPAGLSGVSDDEARALMFN